MVERSSWRRNRVHRTAASISGSLSGSENLHGKAAHHPLGTCRTIQRFHSTCPRGLVLTSERSTNARRRWRRNASMRPMTGPGSIHGGTSRADPGTRGAPPKPGSTVNPMALKTAPKAAQRKRGSMRRPARRAGLLGFGPSPEHQAGRGTPARRISVRRLAGRAPGTALHSLRRRPKPRAPASPVRRPPWSTGAWGRYCK